MAKRCSPARLVLAIVLAALLLREYLSANSIFTSRRRYSLLNDSPDVQLGGPCSPFAGGAISNLTIVVKLGAAEVSSRLATYLDPLARCSPDILLFSDRFEQYQSYTIIDALANLPDECKTQNPDFAVYDDIQRANRTLRKTTDGWKLDKYKFLPMMEMVAHMRPHSPWFVFVEPDTYVNWDNMYRFLRKFDPDQPHYMGSPVWPVKKPTFAHGGTGYVLSHGAMDKLVEHGKQFRNIPQTPGTHQFGMDLTRECCGDDVLAQVLKASGVHLRGYWPMFNGEKPTTVRFGREHWCEAVISLHHLTKDDFADLENWEAKRPHPSTPLTFAELFSYIEPTIRSRREDWSNLSEDVTISTPYSAGESFDNCFEACLRNRKCVQYEHFRDTCRLSYTTRMGHAQTPKGFGTGKTRWTSGWVTDRIEAFKAAHSPCIGAHLVHPNP
ncbi:hypothetical protein BCR34DRAFT_376245 [Clohesyomyces aquaticus]|uniref:N-acetylgalactosaminide beta-1,3-galactosyltransferase n=1 Tax=Clohesyomyces aquaticus TaxID=1231657 RepID=A0A1Y1ZG41_9PLEO|nr:hypothetical protein BCR34DRAFT_376245 [Clohesyomyces aquaticus]